MTVELDYTSPNVKYSFDLNQSPLVKYDQHNLINVLGKKQLNSLDQVSLLDIYLSKSKVVEPHYHQNLAELVYCIAGSLCCIHVEPFYQKAVHLHHYPWAGSQCATRLVALRSRLAGQNPFVSHF